MLLQVVSSLREQQQRRDYAGEFKDDRDMTQTSMASENPFVDPNPSFEEHPRDHSFTIDSTLAVGRDATLTLGTDSLIVLGDCA